MSQLEKLYNTEAKIKKRFNIRNIILKLNFKIKSSRLDINLFPHDEIIIMIYIYYIFNTCIDIGI